MSLLGLPMQAINDAQPMLTSTTGFMEQALRSDGFPRCQIVGIWSRPLPGPVIYPPGGSVVLLPSAELQFSDANGHPYAGGTLELLVPGTTTPKDTWTDPDGAALNTNPIVLDAAGRCIVYGDGAYR